MAKRIIWSKSAVSDRIRILDYWYRKIGTKSYSNKLDHSFRAIVKLISKFPDIGRKIEAREERYFVKDHYKIFYSYSEDSVEILHIWDTRRNPEDTPFS